MATTSRKGTAIHVRLSHQEAERIRIACATALRNGTVRTMNEWQKRALLDACDRAPLSDEPAG